MSRTLFTSLKPSAFAALASFGAFACGGTTNVTVIAGTEPDAGVRPRLPVSSEGGTDVIDASQPYEAGARDARGDSGDSAGCAPSRTRCQGGASMQTCSSDGVWGLPDSCGDAGSCYGDRCIGVCAQSSKRCFAHNAQSCNVDGTWIDSDVCYLDAQICRAGACVTNDPYSLGYDTVDGTWIPFTFPQSSVYFMPVVIPTTALHVAAQVLPNVSGGDGRMYLYTDASGAPGTLIGIAGTFPIGTVNSSNTITPLTLVSNQLTAGQTYWLGGEFSLSGSNVTIWQKPAADSPLFVLTHTFGAPMPNPFDPAAAIKASGLLSYSLVVRDVP